MILVEMQDKTWNRPGRPHYMGERLRAAGWASGWSSSWALDWTDEAAVRDTVRRAYEDEQRKSDYLLFDCEPRAKWVQAENIERLINIAGWVIDERAKMQDKHGRGLAFGLYHTPSTAYYDASIPPIADDDPRGPRLRYLRTLIDFQAVTSYPANSNNFEYEAGRIARHVAAIRAWDDTLPIAILTCPRKKFDNDSEFYEVTEYRDHLKMVARLDPAYLIEWDGNWTGWLSASGQAVLSMLVDFTGGSNVDDYVRSKAKAYEAAMRVVNAEKKRGQVRKLLLQVISEAEQSAADFELLDPVEVPERERLIASARSAKADAEADLEKLK